MWVRGLALLLASALGGAGCGARAEAERRPQPPAGEVWLTPRQMADNTIRVTPAREEEVHPVVVAGGKVTFDDLKVSHVFSPVTGRVTQIIAQPGQRVKQGDPLARIASPDVGSAFADVVKAQADLVAAEHEYKRQQELYAAHAGSRRDFETAQDNYRKAQAEYRRAQERTRLLRSGSVNAVTQEYTLRAPIAGEVITRTNLNPGTEVTGQYSGGNAVELFTIGELDEVWVLADIFEVDLPRVKAGGPVRVQVIAYPRNTFSGKVEWVADALDPVTRTAKVRCSIPNPDHELKPEMYATISIAAPGKPMLVVPREAVLRLGETTVVFVESGTTRTGQLRFARRPVIVDEEESEELVPVTHGLNPGERVVSAGAILLAGAS
jgi:cobalt-zinc-cadmium efflux system membrane fusion protein